MSEVIQPTRPVMNRRQAAALLGVSEVTLKRWAQAGTGPTYTKMGDAKNAPVRYTRAEIALWLKSRER